MNGLQPGMNVNPHSHPCEQVVGVVRGPIRFVIDDEELEIKAGGLIRISPKVLHFGEPFGDEVLLNLNALAPIRDDYRHLVEYQNKEFAGSENEG
ncbi:MAG: cupin domain-containing protein [Pseudomonadales bacterium]